MAVEIEAYRPFFILGEVRPRPVSLCAEHDGRERSRHCRRVLAARTRDRVTVTHTDAGTSRVVPLGTPLSPGDTVLVGERWF